MQLRSDVSLSEGQRNLQAIIKELASKNIDWNEATTRLHVIDRLLVECLGWQKTPERFKVEVHQLKSAEFSPTPLPARNPRSYSSSHGSMSRSSSSIWRSEQDAGTQLSSQPTT